MCAHSILFTITLRKRKEQHCVGDSAIPSCSLRDDPDSENDISIGRFLNDICMYVCIKLSNVQAA